MGSVTDYKPPTMNDLPVPQGSWQDAYSARQRKYNLQLLTGIAVLGGTLTYVSCFHLQEDVEYMSPFENSVDILVKFQRSVHCTISTYNSNVISRVWFYSTARHRDCTHSCIKPYLCHHSVTKNQQDSLTLLINNVGDCLYLTIGFCINIPHHSSTVTEVASIISWNDFLYISHLIYHDLGSEPPHSLF